MGKITLEFTDEDEREIIRIAEKYYGKTQEDLDRAVTDAINFLAKERERKANS